MFRSRDFIPVAVAGLLVVILVIAGLLQSNACAGNWSCWVISPSRVLFGRYELPENATWLLVLAQQLGKYLLLFGALISSLRVGLSAARHDFRVALARRKKNHIIVCGLGQTGIQIVRHMRKQGTDVVVVDRADDSINAAACDRDGIPVIRGDATNIDVLRAAGLKRARTVAICTGDDAINMDVALLVRDTATRKFGIMAPLNVLAEMRDQWLYTKLIDHDRKTLGLGNVALRLFNNYDNAARLLIRSLRLPPGPEIDPGAFVLVGFGAMGRQLMLQIVRLAPAALGSKTKIVVFDRNADQCKLHVLTSHPALADLADLEFIAADIGPEASFNWEIVEAALRGRPLLAAAVCLRDDQHSLYAALTLRRHLDDLARIHVPVFVRLERHRHLGQFAADLSRMGVAENRLSVFGGLEELLQPDILMQGKLDLLATAFHRHWLASLAPGQNGGPAAKPWDELAETFKMANRRRADLVPTQLAQAGLRVLPAQGLFPALQLTDEEIELLARLEHRRWSIDRRLLGYSYGAVRSENPPRHPLLVDWDELPESVRQSNREDVRKMPEIVSGANFEIRRDRKIILCNRKQSTAQQNSNAAQESYEDSVVIADIDSTDGQKAAETAAAAPNASLWLVSAGDHDRTPPTLSKAVWESAAGWISTKQLTIV